MRRLPISMITNIVGRWVESWLNIITQNSNLSVQLLDQ